MNRSLCWVDEKRWRRLVERSGLLAPAGDRAPRERTAPAGPAAVAPRRTAPTAPRAPEPPAEYRGTLEQRLEQLLAWIGRATAAEVLFVADESGLPLASVGPSSELVTTGALLSTVYAELWPAGATRRPLSTCLLFPGGRVLAVTEAKTDLGHFALGYLCDGFTDQRLLARIRRELEHAFEEKGDFDG